MTFGTRLAVTDFRMLIYPSPGDKHAEKLRLVFRCECIIDVEESVEVKPIMSIPLRASTRDPKVETMMKARPRNDSIFAIFHRAHVHSCCSSTQMRAIRRPKYSASFSELKVVLKSEKRWNW